MFDVTFLESNWKSSEPDVKAYEAGKHPELVQGCWYSPAPASPTKRTSDVEGGQAPAAIRWQFKSKGAGTTRVKKKN